MKLFPFSEGFYLFLIDDIVRVDDLCMYEGSELAIFFSLMMSSSDDFFFRSPNLREKFTYLLEGALNNAHLKARSKKKLSKA
jgi:hypothetical protein